MNIRYSQIAQFLKCQKSYEYGYVQQLEPVRLQDKLFLGTAIHAGIEAYFKNENIIDSIDRVCNEALLKDNINEEDVEGVSYIRQTARDIVPRALDFLPGNMWEPIEINGKKAIEYKFRYDLNGNMIVGTVDLVARHKPTNQVFIIDHKTRGTLKDEDAEQYNLQLAFYQYILKKLGVDVVGSAIFQIKSEPLATPKLNKNRTMSRSKISTTWNHYKKCLIENGLDPDEYEYEMQPKLESNEFFKLNKVFRSEKTINNMWDNIILPTIENIKSVKKFIPNMTPMTCNFCSFSSLCNSEIDGSDTDYIKLINFKQRGEKVYYNFEEK